jgi:hypothetical protein
MPRTVHVLTIDHKHGVEISAHASREAAEQALFGYVASLWDEEFDGARLSLADCSRAEAIEAYFDRRSEDYRSIVECALDEPGRRVAVAFDRETANYQGYERLSDAEKDLLVAQAADLLGEMPSVVECIGVAFDSCAQRLGYVSDDCYEQLEAERSEEAN